MVKSCRSYLSFPTKTMDTVFGTPVWIYCFQPFPTCFFPAHQERPMSIPKEVETHAADARRQREREVKAGSEDDRKCSFRCFLPEDTRSSLPETNWSDEKTYRHTSGFFPSRDWDPNFHFLFFIKKYQLRDVKTMQIRRYLPYIYHINRFIWLFSSTVVIDMSSQIENRMGWMGYMIALLLQDLSLFHGQELIQAQLRHIVEDGSGRESGQKRSTKRWIEDEHGTYKSPSLKGKWSEPNLHADMFQPFIFQGVGTPFDQMHNDCWRKPYIHIILICSWYTDLL